MKEPECDEGMPNQNFTIKQFKLNLLFLVLPSW